MSRPELPALSRGDRLVLRGGTPGFSYTLGQATEVRVVIVGPKYVHVVDADRFDRLDLHTDRFLVRKFLLADQKEGSPGGRIGYPATVATPEQHAYDVARAEARAYLDGQGIDLQSRSPWRGREIDLAAAVKAAIDA